MLTIRKEQMDQMLTHDESRLIDFVVGHVQRECRDSVRDIDPRSLREMVSNGMTRARRHGLTGPRDLTAFVAIMFEIAPNFDDQPDIRRALGDSSVLIEQRFDRMLERVPDWAWEEAQRYKVSAAWFPELLAEPGLQP